MNSPRQTPSRPRPAAGGGSCLVGGRSRIGSDGIGARLPRLILTRFRHVNRARTHVGLPPFFLQNRTVADIRLRAFSALTEPAFWFAAIAQLVEHVIRNDGVTGSSPVCGTTIVLK